MIQSTPPSASFVPATREAFAVPFVDCTAGSVVASMVGNRDDESSVRVGGTERVAVLGDEDGACVDALVGRCPVLVLVARMAGKS